jgi:penicillin-binding protein 1C
MSARSAALVLDILSDADARVPGFGISTPFDFAFPVAAKTGTSRHFTDNWAVGVTRRFTVAVWVGNFNGRPMEGVSGVTGAGPLLHRAVLATAARYTPGVLPTPAETGAISTRICRLSGMLATAECPDAVEWFTPGTEPKEICTWHDHGRVVLPQLYAEWLDQARALDAKPSGSSQGSGLPAGFRILSPLDGDRYAVPPSVDARYATIALRATGASGTVRWTVDDRPVASARLPLVRGTHVVRALSGGESREVRITVD